MSTSKIVGVGVVLLSSLVAMAGGQEKDRLDLATRLHMDDYEVMPLELTFTPDQQTAFDAAVAARNTAYEKWMHEEQGKRYTQLQQDLAAARRAGNPTVIEDVQGKIAIAHSMEIGKRADLRREFDKVLTLEQQKQWAGWRLFAQTIAKFNRVTLSGEQEKQARQVCQEMADKAVTDKTCETDPYLNLDPDLQERAFDQVLATVLTQNQATKARPATKPAE